MYGDLCDKLPAMFTEVDVMSVEDTAPQVQVAVPPLQVGMVMSKITANTTDGAIDAGQKFLDNFAGAYGTSDAAAADAFSNVLTTLFQGAKSSVQKAVLKALCSVPTAKSSVAADIDSVPVACKTMPKTLCADPLSEGEVAGETCVGPEWAGCVCKVFTSSTLKDRTAQVMDHAGLRANRRATTLSVSTEVVAAIDVALQSTPTTQTFASGGGDTSAFAGTLQAAVLKDATSGTSLLAAAAVDPGKFASVVDVAVLNETLARPVIVKIMKTPSPPTQPPTSYPTVSPYLGGSPSMSPATGKPSLAPTGTVPVVSPKPTAVPVPTGTPVTSAPETGTPTPPPTEPPPTGTPTSGAPVPAPPPAQSTAPSPMVVPVAASPAGTASSLGALCSAMLGAVVVAMMQ